MISGRCRIFGLSVVTAVCYWLADSIVLVFHGRVENILLSLAGLIPAIDLFHRLSAVLLLLALGLAGNRLFDTRMRAVAAAREGAARHQLLAQRHRRVEESHREWLDALDAVRDLIFLHDREGRVLGANRAYAEHAGLTLSELRGRYYWEVFPRGDGLLPGCRHLMESGGDHGGETVEVGDGRVFNSRAFVIRTEDGRYSHSLHILEDVTEQQNTEHALREREARIAAIYEAAHNVSFIMTDLDGTEARVLEFSPGAEQLFGYSREEMIGRPVALLHPPDDVARFPEVFRAMAEQRHGFSGEALLIRRGGERFPALFTSYPLLDPQGEMVAALGVSVDISAQKQTEQALRRSNEELEAVFGSIRVLIAVMDPEFNFVRVNTAYATAAGGTPDDFKGRNHFELYPHEDNQRLFRHVVESGEACSVVARPFQHPAVREGQLSYWDWTLAPIKEGARVEGVVLTLIDVTEREYAVRALHRAHDELEERVHQRTAELESMNRQLESFSYSVSHDLRGPLRTINGFSSVLMEEHRDRLDEEAFDCLRRIKDASDRMDRLIDGLLNLSRIARTELHPQAVNLSAMATEIGDELRQAQPQRVVEFSVTPDLVVNADPHLARILLSNLLENAWKFTSRRERARIEFGRLPDEGAYYVRDNGAGFDMAYSDKLFGAFQRLHAPSEFPGTGIGLATVARIVHAHRGRIWAEGREGEGAAFFFTFGAG